MEETQSREGKATSIISREVKLHGEKVRMTCRSGSSRVHNHTHGMLYSVVLADPWPLCLACKVSSPVVYVAILDCEHELRRRRPKEVQNSRTHMVGRSVPAA